MRWPTKTRTSSWPALARGGLSGPWRDYKAYDINLAAAGGICEGLGDADREPLTFGTPEVGYFAGMAAASSIVMALLARDTHGGQHIDIAEAETMAGLYNGPEALMAVYQWRVTRRTGHHALDFPYPNCILRCKDGHIFVGSRRDDSGAACCRSWAARSGLRSNGSATAPP